MRARASRKLAPLQSTLVLVVLVPLVVVMVTVVLLVMVTVVLLVMVAAVLVRVFFRLEFYLGSTFRHTLVDTGLLNEQTPLAFTQPQRPSRGLFCDRRA